LAKPFGISVALLLTLVSHHSLAKKSVPVLFDEIEMEAPFNLTHPIMTLDLLPQKGKEIVTFSVDEKGTRWLIIYALTADQALEEVNRVELPKSFYSYDMTTYRSGKLQTIYFLSSDAVFQFSAQESQTKQFKELSKIQSIAVGEQEQYLSKGEFLVDLNNDEKDDLFVQDFHLTHFIVSNKNDVQHIKLPIKPRSKFNSGSSEYQTTAMYFSDMNFDGLIDVVYVKKGQLIYFKQTIASTFDQTPHQLAISDNIHGIDWWDQRDENGDQYDQSNLAYKKIEQLKDINNDSIVDMVVRYTQSEGVLDKANDYEVYLGSKEGGKLVFQDSPTSIIKGDGTLIGIEFVDVNDDKKLEVMVSGFDIGVSQIIGALLSGSIDQDVHLFYMNENDTFDSKLKVSKEVELTFSLSSGTSGSPIVKLADLNGDKRQDLVLSDDDDTLLIYFGVDSDSLFTKKSKKYKTLIPAQGKMVIHDDINDDGKDDLLIKYGREDDKTLAKLFKILVSR
jgi:hypothetical protein